MAKSRPPTTPLVRPQPLPPVEPPYRPPEAEQGPPPAAAQVEYAWPSKVRCPHCGRTDAKVNGVCGAVRYLKCRHASCGRTWSVTGTPI